MKKINDVISYLHAIRLSRINIRNFFSIIFILAISNPSFGENVYKPTAVEINALLEDQEIWYGGYVNDDQKIGWLSYDNRIIPDSDAKNGKVYVINMHDYEKTMFEGTIEIIEFKNKQIYESQHPYRIIEIFQTNVVDKNVSTIHGVRKGDDFEVSFKNNDSENIEILKNFQYSLYDEYSAVAWIKKKRHKGDRTTQKYFLFDELDYSINDYEITDVTITRQSGVDSILYKTKIHMKIPNGDTYTAKSLTDENAIDIYFKLDNGFEYRLEKKENAKNLDKIVDLYVYNNINVSNKIPLKIYEEWVNQIVFEINGKYENQIHEDIRQKITDLPNGNKILTLKNVPLENSNEDIFEYLEKGSREDEKFYAKETPAYPYSNPKIQFLLDQIIRENENINENEWDDLHILADFVSDYIEDDLVNNSASVFDVIESKKGDCSEHALLFNTLSRSFGYPAREVMGFSYGEDGKYGGHAWNEVLLDFEGEGLHWVPVDSMWNQVLPQGHIKTNLNANLKNDYSLELKKVVYANGEIDEF